MICDKGGISDLSIQKQFQADTGMFSRRSKQSEFVETIWVRWQYDIEIINKADFNANSIQRILAKLIFRKCNKSRER